jgi:hypothetical protein
VSKIVRLHHKPAKKKRASLGTVIDVEVGNRELHLIHASEATPAKLADPDVTIQLSEQETKEAHDISRRARSTS